MKLQNELLGAHVFTNKWLLRDANLLWIRLVERM